MYRIVINNGDMFDIDADKAEDYGDELLFCRNNDKDNCVAAYKKSIAIISDNPKRIRRSEICTHQKM